MVSLNAGLMVLEVVVPLLGAPLAVALGGARRAWGLATLASWASLAMACALLARVLAGSGPFAYTLGGWAAPWGIEYRVDALNALVLVVVSGASALVLLFARLSVAREVAAHQQVLFYACWLLNLAGMLGMTVTGDVFNLFVFLEIASLSSYALIATADRPEALLAAFRYLILGSIGATFILVGIGLLYMMTGTLNMADLALHLPAVARTRTVQVAFGFIAVGFGLKMAFFPLHHWQPEAYARAPSAVSAFFAATSTKVAFYALLRFVFSVFGAGVVFGEIGAARVLLAISLVGVIAASLVALYEADVKRLLAWSSIAQIGYMVLAMSTGTALGLTASIVHLFNHALMKGALFLAVGCLAYRIGPVTVDGVAGLGRRLPWTMAAFTAAGLSLVGVPFTAGFVSKWYLLTALFARGWWGAAVVVIATSLIAAGYIWRVVESAYFRPQRPEHAEARLREAPASMLVPLWILVGLNLYFGLFTTYSAGVAARAARVLLGFGG